MVSQNAAFCRRGLTLMELLVVVAIIALLAALLLLWSTTLANAATRRLV